MLRTLIPAISAASIQVSFFAIAFNITSCSFIIRSVSRTGITWLDSTPPASTFRTDRTTHVLIGPDNSHANDIDRPRHLTGTSGGDTIAPTRFKGGSHVKAVLGLFLLAGVLSAQHSYTPADVENGARLYRGNCVNCHGPDGNFIPGVDFSNGKFLRAVSDDDIAHVIINGVPGAGMPAHNFSQAQAELVVAYLRSLAATAGHYSSGSGDAARGKALVEGKGQCLMCHRIDGHGSRFGPDLSDVGAIRRAGDLEQSLVDPNAEIAPDNRYFHVV